jgi:hypothetical protein
MLPAVLALLGGLAMAAASPATASLARTGLSTEPRAASNIVPVAGGCGWGFHLTYWGGCVPNGYGYSRRSPYWRYHYYGGRYHRHWR